MLSFDEHVRERELGRDSASEVMSELSLSRSSSFSSELGSSIAVALLEVSISADSFLRSFFRWSIIVGSILSGSG